MPHPTLPLLLLGLAVLPLPAQAVELVERGATWRFLDDGSNQGTSWIGTGFNDSSWFEGDAQLGYGDGDEDTYVDFGPNASNKYVTTYFRHTFNVANPGTLQGLTLQLMRDDGAVVYLNGSEVHRSNMPGGAIGYLTLADGTIGGVDEDTMETVALDPLDIDPGVNVIAVEIHQRSVTSSDISFDLQLATGPATVIRGPYLQVGRPDAVIVRWRTDIATDSRVRYGSGPSQLTQTVTIGGTRTEHEVELTGLSAETLYFYDVGATGLSLAGGDVDHHFVTSPTASSSPLITFWVTGDSGECAQTQEGCDDVTAVADAYLDFAGSLPARLWLMLGDNAYDIGTENEHTRGVFDAFPQILRNTVLWPSPGNHEFGASDSPSQTGPYYEGFTLPTAGEAGGLTSGTEAYYSFDYGNVHFVALDSHDTDRSAPANPTTNVCPGGQGGAMYQWVCADLAATDRDFVIAFWHHPPYTKGSHDSDDSGDSGGRMEEMRERFLPVFEEYGVDLVLTGHSHSYERSMLIDGHYGLSSGFGPANQIDGGDGDPDGDGAYAKGTAGLAPHEGAVYAVVGSSSKNTGGLSAHPVMSVWVNFEGSLLVDVNGLRLDAYWIDKNGVLADRFRIVKGSTDVPALQRWGGVMAAAALVMVGLAVTKRPA